jgi:hypothetical protein
MIEELDVIALRTDHPEHGLVAGEKGTVVMIFDDAYEVEFVNEDGTTRVMAPFAMEDVELVWCVASIRGEATSAALKAS